MPHNSEPMTIVVGFALFYYFALLTVLGFLVRWLISILAFECLWEWDFGLPFHLSLLVVAAAEALPGLRRQA